MVKITICLLVVGLSGMFCAPAPQEDVQILHYDNDNNGSGNYAPAPQEYVKILHYDNDNNGSGNYAYRYELSNGQIHWEAGNLSNDGEGPVVVSGSYSFVSPDGETHWVNYTADEEGFHPVVGQGPGANPLLVKSLVG